MKGNVFLVLILLSFWASCKSSTPRTVEKMTEATIPTSNAKPEPPPKKEAFLIPKEPMPEQRLFKIYRVEDWNRVPEGFLDGSTYQVKVTSLKPQREEAVQEAIEVAKRKAVAMLQKEGTTTKSPESKVEIKILVEEFGKLVAETDLIEDRRFFVFQVKRPALEIIVKELSNIILTFRNKSA